jgi:hypothetical protein
MKTTRPTTMTVASATTRSQAGWQATVFRQFGLVCGFFSHLDAGRIVDAALSDNTEKRMKNRQFCLRNQQ